ncbi:HAD hydrolase-like protein [Corynebacterium sp.]|uniref:HAD hydrolase-like protein n=1 Tax=Corynebacterium sp. TaxID=1720 RepID=UPI0026E02961|nr:HAD hydrolase-like protein [Corynebacterium sp.]MDO5511403.1 HAD hydrolase-like protein [Corynebacterium sp.]
MSILLLDVDGTLIDSLPGIRGGLLHTLDTLGWPHPPQEFQERIAGPPMEVTLQSLGMSPAQAQEGLQIYLEYTRAGGWGNATSFPDMLDLVRTWKEQGLTIATATSKGETFARQILEREGFLEHIDFLGAAQEDGPRRGKSAVIDHVLSSTGWSPETHDILMVGDRSHDIEGAAAHGIDTVAVAWGYGTPQEWARAAHTAHTPQDLEGIVHDWHAARG